MDNFSFNDPLIYNRRKGDSNDPFIDIKESLILDNNAKVTLTEVPSEWHGLSVEGLNQDWFEIREGLPSDNEYLVDYPNRQVTFNKNHIGKQLSFSFKGTGNTFTSASSIYTERNGLEIKETLNVLTDTTAQARDEVIQTNKDVKAAESIRKDNESQRKIDHTARVGEFNGMIDDTRYTEPYNATTQYSRNNVVTFNGASFMAKKDTKGNEPPNIEIAEDNEFWGLLTRKGADGEGTVKTPFDKFIATEGQKVFNLSYTYDQFQGRTNVTVGGVPQFTPEHYEETTSKSITFKEGLPAGVVVEVKYFSESVPLKSDIQTTVSGHTSAISDHSVKINKHEEDLTSVNSQLAQTMNQNVYAESFPIITPEVDDTARIQRAIDSLNDTGGNVIFAPKEYVFGGHLQVKRSNIYLIGVIGKTVFHFNGTDGTTVFLHFYDDRDDGYKTNYDNSPAYQSLRYFDPLEYGSPATGTDYRLSNVGIENITFKIERSINYGIPLGFTKCDDFYAKNLRFTFVGQPTQANHTRTYFCSNGIWENIIYEDNVNTAYGHFVYWSFNVKSKNIRVGSVSATGFEYKHGVMSIVEDIEVKGTGSKGVSIGYGSIGMDLKKVRVFSYDTGIRIGSSTGFDYSEEFSLENISVDVVTNGLVLSGVKNTKINNISLKAYQPIVFQKDKRFVFSQTDDTGVVQNTGYFTYDGDYDTKEQQTFFGVTHWRYYEITHLPQADNLTFDNVNLEIKPGNTVTTQAILFVAPGNVPVSSTITNKKLKRFGEDYALYVNNVRFKDIEIIGETSKNHNGVYFQDHVLKDCKFENVKLRKIKGHQFRGIKLDGTDFIGLNPENDQSIGFTFAIQSISNANINKSNINLTFTFFRAYPLNDLEEGFTGISISNVNFKGVKKEGFNIIVWRWDLGDLYNGALEYPKFINCNFYAVDNLLVVNGTDHNSLTGKYHQTLNLWNGEILQ